MSGSTSQRPAPQTVWQLVMKVVFADASVTAGLAGADVFSGKAVVAAGGSSVVAALAVEGAAVEGAAVAVATGESSLLDALHASVTTNSIPVAAATLHRSCMTHRIADCHGYQGREHVYGKSCSGLDGRAITQESA